MKDEIRTWRPKFRGKDGRWYEVAKYTVDIVDRRERRFRKVLKFSISESANLSREVGRRIRDLVNYAAVGQPNPDLVTWFQDHADRKLQQRLADLGLLPRTAPKVVRPLLEYLPEFQRAIFEKSKADKKKKITTVDTSAKTMTARVRKIIEGCGFGTWDEVTAERVEQILTQVIGQMIEPPGTQYAPTATQVADGPKPGA